MKKWFMTLSQSERRLMVVGGLLIAVALFWVMVYQPLNRHLDSQVKTKARLATQLAQMQQLTQTVSTSQVSPVQPLPAGTTFSSWVDRQLQQVNLQQLVNRTEPVNSDALVIWMQGVPFDQLADWLQQIAMTYAVTVDQIDVNVVDSSLGITNIRMRLTKQ